MIVIAQTYPHLARQLSAEPWSSREFALVRAAWEMAAELFAGAERGSGKPFVDHLSRHRIGCRWAAATLTRPRSARVYAAYDQGDFDDGRRALPSHRRRVLAALGVTVEDLVHDYNAVNWDERLVDPRRGLCDVSPALLLLPSSAQSARVCACRPGFGSDVGPAPCGRSRAVRARCAAA